MPVPISVVILTYNEEGNLPNALESIAGWAGQIIVIDSFSTDKTLQIAKDYKCDIYQNQFESYFAQRNWALKVPRYDYKWIMYIDADEQVTSELRSEIESALSTVSDDVAGFMMRRRQIFLGKWIKHGGCYLWLMRLFRRDRSRFVKSHLGGEYPVVHGGVRKLRSDIIHLNHKPLTFWIQRQNKESTVIALGLHKRSIVISGKAGLKRGENIEGSIRTWLNYRIHSHLPLLVRPFAHFMVNYVFRGGLLDGRKGFYFHFANSFVYPFFLAMKYEELKESDVARKFAEQCEWR